MSLQKSYKIRVSFSLLLDKGSQHFLSFNKIYSSTYLLNHEYQHSEMLYLECIKCRDIHPLILLNIISLRLILIVTSPTIASIIISIYIISATCMFTRVENCEKKKAVSSFRLLKLVCRHIDTKIIFVLHYMFQIMLVYTFKAPLVHYIVYTVSTIDFSQ